MSKRDAGQIGQQNRKEVGSCCCCSRNQPESGGCCCKTWTKKSGRHATRFYTNLFYQQSWAVTWPTVAGGLHFFCTAGKANIVTLISLRPNKCALPKPWRLEVQKMVAYMLIALAFTT
uniref:(northern house mosquito) hypothetical protein n=1 Tax=Culex pipiens TaxID=7175 RepID=A0A8D8BR40_CULPI